MGKADKVYGMIERAKKPSNAITYVYFSLLNRWHDDFGAKIPTFGFELMKSMFEKVEDIRNLDLSVDESDRYFHGYLGLISGESDEEVRQGICKLEDIARINPFEKAFFEDAERRFRKECVWEYKVRGATELDSLGEELVQFFQVREHYRREDGHEPTKKQKYEVRQIFVVKEPLILGSNLGIANEEIRKYFENLEGIPSLFSGVNFNVPKNFDVVSELGLKPLLKKKLTSDDTFSGLHHFVVQG